MKISTTNLRLPSPRAWWNLEPPIAAAIAFFCLLAIAALIGRIQSSAPQAAAVPTPALPMPIIIIATSAPAPTAAPTAAPVLVAALPAGPVTQRAIVVYARPDTTSAIGAVEPGRSYQVLARYGAEWLQVDMTGSGVVYALASDVLDLPVGLVDLQPAPAVIVVERPVYVQAPPAAAPTIDVTQYETTNAQPDRTAEQEAERLANIRGHYVEPVQP